MTDPTYIETQRLHSWFDTPERAAPYLKRCQRRARHLVARLLKAAEGVDPAPRPDILDVGCRTGTALPIFHEAFPHSRIVGVDIVPEFLAEAIKLGDEVCFGDAHALPFEDREFNWIFCHHTLEHCHDPLRAWHELRRVASTGIFLTVPLEDERAFAENPAHFLSHDSPLGWLNWFDDPKWLLALAAPSTDCDVEIIYVRNPYYSRSAP